MIDNKEGEAISQSNYYGLGYEFYCVPTEWREGLCYFLHGLPGHEWEESDGQNIFGLFAFFCEEVGGLRVGGQEHIAPRKEIGRVIHAGCFAVHSGFMTVQEFRCMFEGTSRKGAHAYLHMGSACCICSTKDQVAGGARPSFAQVHSQ